MANVGAVDQVRADLEAARNEKQAQIVALQGEVAQIDGALTALAGLPASSSSAPAAPMRASAPAKPKPANGRRRRAKAAAAAAPAAEKPKKPANGRRRRATKSRPGTISAAVEDYLDAKHPNAVHASEVLDHLSTSGSTPGGNARNVLQSTLNRLQERGTVRNVGKNRWRRIRPRGRQPK